MSAALQLRCWFLLVFNAFLVLCYGQTGDTVRPVITADSLDGAGFVQVIRQLAEKEVSTNQQAYKDGQISIKQLHTIEAIRTISQEVKIFMKNGLDTAEILNDLEQVNESLVIAKDGVFTNNGSSQTQRNLSVTAKIIAELSDKMAERKIVLDKYTAALINYKDKIDSLSGDTSLFALPSDSVAIIKYGKRLMIVDREVHPIDSTLKMAVANAQELQLKVDLMVFNLHSLGEDIEIYRTNLASKVFEQEFSAIWDPVTFSRPMEQILGFSIAKEKMALGFYVRDNYGRLFLLMILITAMTLFTKNLKRMMIQEDLLDPAYQGQLVLKRPLLSSIFVVLNIFQYIFIDPPFVFSFVIFGIDILCLTIIVKDVLARYWMRFWYIVMVYFLLAAFDNFLLQASRTERWLMFLLAVSGLVLIAYIFLTDHRKELKERGIIYFVLFVGLFEMISLTLNIFGRFNIAKSFLVTGFFGIAIAVLFFWTARLINELLRLANRVYKFPDRKMFYINFEKIGSEVPGFFYVLLVVGWFFIMSRNFYLFKQIVYPVEEFLIHNRTIRQFSFSLADIIIFILILFTSFSLSRIISFFATSPSPASGSSKSGKIGLGSWILLVRILILSLGIFFAFAATGIPIDRLTIILGALSVGIGLGLQNLVSNLVSGLIIAFEKPVNVGDILELNGRQATMRSIGFRSSIVRFNDGSHVVIPNVDILNQHIVNWSMGANFKRTSVAVKLAYGSDLEKASALFIKVLEDTEYILKSPAPFVNAQNFGTYAVELELFFWVHRVTDFDPVRSEVIMKVDAACKKEGIEIAVPQQNITISPLPGNPADHDPHTA